MTVTSKRKAWQAADALMPTDYEKDDARTAGGAKMTATRMPYSVYKKYYYCCETVEGSYNAKPKTICVYLPEQKTAFPKTWRRNGNHYETPGGCRVYFWNTGAARSYLVEHGSESRTIPPGIDSAARVCSTVAEFENK